MTRRPDVVREVALCIVCTYYVSLSSRRCFLIPELQDLGFSKPLL